MQVRFVRLCERMDDASNSTFKYKSLRTIKKKALILLTSREMESITWKVKKAWENMWKTLWKG